MKRRFTNPSSPNAVLAEQVAKARQAETTALQVLLDRRKELVAQAARETEPAAKERFTAKVSDLDDAIRLRKRELKQLYPDQIKRTVKRHAADPNSSQRQEAIAKITWAKPYRG